MTASSCQPTPLEDRDTYGTDSLMCPADKSCLGTLGSVILSHHTKGTTNAFMQRLS